MRQGKLAVRLAAEDGVGESHGSSSQSQTRSTGAWIVMAREPKDLLRLQDGRNVAGRTDPAGGSMGRERAGATGAPRRPTHGAGDRWRGPGRPRPGSTPRSGLVEAREPGRPVRPGSPQGRGRRRIAWHAPRQSLLCSAEQGAGSRTSHYGPRLIQHQRKALAPRGAKYREAAPIESQEMEYL